MHIHTQNYVRYFYVFENALSLATCKCTDRILIYTPGGYTIIIMIMHFVKISFSIVS